MSRLAKRLMTALYTGRSDRVGGTERYGRLLRLHIPSGSVVLDIGAGNGTGFNHEEYLDAVHLVGLDPDAAVLDNNHVSESVVGSAEDMPFPGDSFDAVVSNYSLEHIQDPLSLTREIARVLKPGGRFVFRTPNLWHYVAACNFLVPGRFRDRVFRLATGGGEDQERYPSFYRFNSWLRVHSICKRTALAVDTLYMYEDVPAYLQMSVLTFLLGVLYERVVGSLPGLALFQGNIMGVLRKSDSGTSGCSPGVSYSGR